MKLNEFRVRDLRSKEKFFMDDEYLNGYARLCGWQSTVTYISLCRHSNKEQESFPSINLIAEENRVDRKTIIKGLQTLTDWNIIRIEKCRSEKGTWQNNTYILLDRSEWKPKPLPDNQVPVEDMEPSPSDGHGTKSFSSHHQVPVEDSKDTHIKDTSLLRNVLLRNTLLRNNETKSFGNEEINECISLLKEMNNGVLPKEKLNRFAINRLLKSHGKEKILRLIKLAFEIRDKPYAPVITNYIELERKYEQFKAWYSRENSSTKKGGVLDASNL